jgi:hypothetical protein
MEEIRNKYKILVRNTQSKRSLGRPRRKWKRNISIDLKGDMGMWTGFM